MTGNTDNFTPASMKFHENTPIEHRKKLGQYMTPAVISKYLISQLDIKPGERVLDPAVGTGELLYHAFKQTPDAYYEGWDVDPLVLSYAKGSLDPKVSLQEKSTLENKTGLGKWDVIIANPPYFEMKLSPEQKNHFAPVLGGRPNIFTLFFYQAANLLKEGGRLGFVVPPSMNNGAFFTRLRSFLLEEGKITSIKVFRDSSLFHGAQTSSQVLIFKKEKPVSDTNEPLAHVFTRENRNIFVEDLDYINTAWKGKHSLDELGYEARTGNIVWNQFKGRFIEEPTSENNAVPIVYASDISAQQGNQEGYTIQWDTRNDYRRYVAQKAVPLTEGIVANRITGGLGSQSLRAAIVREPFYGENHVNVITPKLGTNQSVPLDELLIRLWRVDLQYIAAFTGNTQISARELQYLIPL